MNPDVVSSTIFTLEADDTAALKQPYPGQDVLAIKSFRIKQLQLKAFHLQFTFFVTLSIHRQCCGQ